MREYRYLPLSEIRQREPDMRTLKVSTVARSPRGFLSAYKRAGDRRRLSDRWKVKRHGFIKRHLAQYKKHPTNRRKLALNAWAYEP